MSYYRPNNEIQQEMNTLDKQIARLQQQKAQLQEQLKNQPIIGENGKRVLPSVLDQLPKQDNPYGPPRFTNQVDPYQAELIRAEQHFRNRYDESSRVHRPPPPPYSDLPPLPKVPGFQMALRDITTTQPGAYEDLLDRLSKITDIKKAVEEVMKWIREGETEEKRRLRGFVVGIYDGAEQCVTKRWKNWPRFRALVHGPDDKDFYWMVAAIPSFAVDYPVQPYNDILIKYGENDKKIWEVTVVY